MNNKNMNMNNRNMNNNNRNMNNNRFMNYRFSNRRFSGFPIYRYISPAATRKVNNFYDKRSDVQGAKTFNYSALTNLQQTILIPVTYPNLRQQMINTLYDLYILICGKDGPLINSPFLKKAFKKSIARTKIEKDSKESTRENLAGSTGNVKDKEQTENVEEGEEEDTLKKSSKGKKREKKKEKLRSSSTTG